MVRNGWTRWGRGSCEGYSLQIGGGFVSFGGAVVRNASTPDGQKGAWHSSINGTCSQSHLTCVDAMRRVEFELSIAADGFVSMYARYQAQAHETAGPRSLEASQSDASA